MNTVNSHGVEGKISNILRYVLRVLDVLAGVCFALALVINVSNVIGRYAFHAPLFWAEEVTVLLIIWSVCLMSFKLTLRNEHLVTDILRPFLPARLQTVLAVIVTSWALALSAFIVYYAFKVVQMVSSMSQVTTVAEIPKSLAYSSIIGCFVLVIIASILLLGRIFNPKAKIIPSTESEIEQLTAQRSL